MEIDLKLIATLIGIANPIITVIVFMVFKFNDLAHVEKSLVKIVENQEKQSIKIDNIEKDLSFMKGKSEANDKIVEILEKSLNK